MKSSFNILLLLFIISCSSGPVLYPNKKYKAAGKEKAKADTAECQRLAEEHLKNTKGNQIAKSAGAGAAMSAAGGFIAGLIFSGGSVTDATESAVKSGAVGGAVGAAGGAISPDQLKQRFVTQCLADQGYRVIGWD
jgi:hypothetical protein